jgi:hypothetical protein
MRLRRCKFLEKPVPDGLRKARASVRHIRSDHVSVEEAGRHGHLPSVSVLHGLDRVSFQIDDHLLDLNFIDDDLIRRRLEINDRLYIMLFGESVGELAGGSVLS